MIKLFSKSKPKKAKKSRTAQKSKPAKAKAVPEKAKARAEAEILAPGQPPVPASAPRRKKREMTPEREQLIRNALLVHAHQSKVLDELDDDLKERLRALAVEKLLGGDDGTKH